MQRFTAAADRRRVSRKAPRARKQILNAGEKDTAQDSAPKVGTMTIKPLTDRVLIQAEKGRGNPQRAGIVLTSASQEKPQVSRELPWARAAW